jgi:hypothetical protein
MSAQSTGNAPSPQTLQAAPAIRFEDVVRVAQKDGRLTTITSYVAEDFGLKGRQYEAAPVLARAVAANNTQRVLYIVDGTGALLFTVKEGDARVTYLANRAGVLQQAGRYNPGSFHSEKFESISKAKAAAGFAAEKEFWIRKISSPESDEPVVPVQAVQKVDSKKAAKAAPATTDPDSAPPKKKISWF